MRSRKAVVMKHWHSSLQLQVEAPNDLVHKLNFPPGKRYAMRKRCYLVCCYPVKISSVVEIIHVLLCCCICCYVKVVLKRCRAATVNRLVDQHIINYCPYLCSSPSLMSCFLYNMLSICIHP